VRGKLAGDAEYFTQCNQHYRRFYERVVEIICEHNRDLAHTSFLEIGSNTGLNLFNLAARGARDITGVDWTDHRPAFAWLNKVLGSSVRFVHGSYDNLRHTIDADVPEADVVLNTVFMNHQCDPLQFLAYVCDRARKGVFLWILLNDDSEMSISYGRVSGVHDLGAGKRFPLTFHNDVVISRSLVVESLRQLGFGDVAFPDALPDSPMHGLGSFTMIYAHRTAEIRSAYWPTQATRPEPARSSDLLGTCVGAIRRLIKAR
jgi:SAM-dependent methyltransferase